MKKLLLLIPFIFLVANLLAQESVAVSLKVQGEVELSRAENKGKLTTGAELYSGDQLESKDESFAALKFIDGSTIVKLFPLSILTIKTESENGTLHKHAKLDLGDLWAKVKTGTGSLQVETPTTVVSVKGTQFLLEVDETGATTLYTIEGQVEMKQKEDQETVLVKEGEKAFSRGSGPIEIVPFNIEQMEGEINAAGDAAQTLEIKLENEAGEKRSILIELE